jgi:hypothetical protein
MNSPIASFTLLLYAYTGAFVSRMKVQMQPGNQCSFRCKSLAKGILEEFIQVSTTFARLLQILCRTEVKSEISSLSD